MTHPDSKGSFVSSLVVVVVFSQHLLLARAIRSARRWVFTLPICRDSNGTTDLKRDLQLYVESEPHRGLTFYHHKYNPLTPWWNERGSNPRLSGRKRSLNPLSLQVAKRSWKTLSPLPLFVCVWIEMYSSLFLDFTFFSFRILFCSLHFSYWFPLFILLSLDR